MAQSIIECKTQENITPQVPPVGPITYQMNPPTGIDYERYEVCDVVTATITGNVVPSFTTPNLSVDISGVTVTNDIIVNFFVDWGFKGEYSPTVNYDIVNNTIPNGQYELKVYARLQSGNFIQIASNNYSWDGTTITGLATQVVNRTYDVSVAKVLANWENGNFVSITNVDGSAYTTVGTLTKDCPQLIDDDIWGGGGSGSGTNTGTWRSERITTAGAKVFAPNTLWNLALFLKSGAAVINDGTTNLPIDIGDSIEYGKDILNKNTITITTFAGSDIKLVYILK